MRGARVFTTVSTDEKAKLSREAGADVVIDYTKEDFEAVAKRETGGRGVQVVYDSVGKTTFEKGLAALVPRGMMVLFGQSSGPVGAFDAQILSQRGSLYLTRPSLFNGYIADREELLSRAGDVLGWVREGKLKVRIGPRVPARPGGGSASGPGGPAHDGEGAPCAMISSSETVILVVGATGNVGREVVRQLAAAGVPLRALVRNPAKASHIRLPGVDVVVGDLDAA